MAKKIKTKKVRQKHPLEGVDIAAKIMLENPKFIYNKCTPAFYNELREKYKSEISDTVVQAELNYCVTKARTRLKKMLGPGKERVIQKYKEDLTNLLKSCREKGDIKLEYTVLKDIAALEGIYTDKNPASKNEVVIKDLDTSKLTERQIDRIIAGEDTAKVLMSPNE